MHMHTQTTNDPLHILRETLGPMLVEDRSIFNKSNLPNIEFSDLYDEPKYFERKSLQEAMRSAHASFLKIHGLRDVTEIVEKISHDALKSHLVNKVERLITLLYILEKNTTLDCATDEVKKLELEKMDWLSIDDPSATIKNIKNLALHCGFFFSHKSLIYQRYITEISKELPLIKHHHDYINAKIDLKSTFVKLKTAFEKHLNTSEEYFRNNNKMLKLIRSAMNNPLYNLKKTDENDLLTHFLHKISFSGFHDTLFSKNFETVGKKILDITHVSKDLPLIEQIEQTWLQLKSRGIPSDLINSVKNFSAKEQLKLSEEYIPYVVSGITGKEMHKILDERKFPDNITGSFYETEYQYTVDGKIGDCRIRGIYTPNPTIGLHVAPEFRAVLMLMENSYFIKISPEIYPPAFWNYTNLQNLAGEIENPHAIAIMKLNDEYPLSFHGITATQDSSFFVKPVAVFDEAYRDNFLYELLHDDNFTLKRRLDKKKGGSYYFPLKDKTYWLETLPKIVNLAYDKVKENQQQHNSEKLGNAFKQLVTMSIINAHMLLGVEKTKKIANLNKIGVIKSDVCKSDIDRGGMNTISNFHALSTSENFVTKLGGFHWRPLSVARRLLLDRYTTGFFDLLTVIPHHILQDFARTIGETIHPHRSTLKFKSVQLL